jgi:parvulin-like peptidyl-prolyl isomerase
MRLTRVSVLLCMLLVPLALLAAGCGGGGSASGSVSSDDVAVVAGTHITKEQLDRVLSQVQKSYTLQKRAFPKAGSPEYKALQDQALQTLVQQAEFDQKAKDLKIDIPQKQVDDRLAQIKKQYFGNSETRYTSELAKQGYTDAEVRDQIRVSLVSEAISAKLTSALKVSDADAKKYYQSHAKDYVQPETREVRHILVKKQQLADKLYTEIKDGANFAALAKKYSQDPGSKSQGGKLTITRGQTVPQFDTTAFALKTLALSKPVHTQFGWHIIQALKDTVPSKQTPYPQVKDTIKSQLLSERRNVALSDWYTNVRQEFATKINYATGYAPASTTTTPTTG